jgi:hypothetical protein
VQKLVDKIAGIFVGRSPVSLRFSPTSGFKKGLPAGLMVTNLSAADSIHKKVV